MNIGLKAHLRNCPAEISTEAAARIALCALMFAGLMLQSLGWKYTSVILAVIFFFRLVERNLPDFKYGHVTSCFRDNPSHGQQTSRRHTKKTNAKRSASDGLVID